MQKLERVAKVKVLELSNLYRNYIFVFMMLFLLSTLIVAQNAYASKSGLKASFAHNAGYSQYQRTENFSQARTAFENRDYSYSARLLNELAKNGHVQAQYLLATQYDAGLGVDENASSSFYWYKKAAKAGIDVAQHNLAVAYAQGHGIEADLSKAITWWKRAAVSGNSDSQYNLGIIYASGKGHVKQDITEALKWWRMAAMNGDAIAQFNLGALYANGIGMSSRTCEASRWWKKSAENGFAQAEMALSLLETKHDYAVCRDISLKN